MYQESGPKNPLRSSAATYCAGSSAGITSVSIGTSGACPRRRTSRRSGARRRARRLALPLGIALAEQRLHRVAIGLEPRARLRRSSPRRRAGSPTAPPDTRLRVDRRSTSGTRFAGAKPSARYGTHRFATPSTRSGWWLARFQTTGLPQSWPTQTACRGRALSSSSSMSATIVLQRVVLVAGCTCSSARSRACRARSRESRDRRRHAQLVAPAERQLGPAVHEDDRRAVGRPAGQIERGVARRARQVLNNREQRAGFFLRWSPWTPRLDARAALPAGTPNRGRAR